MQSVRSKSEIHKITRDHHGPWIAKSQPLREKVTKMTTFAWKSHQNDDFWVKVFVDVHSFPLIFIGALTIAENNERKCFTFFRLFNPHLSAFQALVSRTRKSVKRSIDWYQKFLISRFAARYSIVFCVEALKMAENLMKILWKFKNPMKIYGKSHENPLKIYWKSIENLMKI